MCLPEPCEPSCREQRQVCQLPLTMENRREGIITADCRRGGKGKLSVLVSVIGSGRILTAAIETGGRMETQITDFIAWIHLMNGSSYNTEISYQRDLRKMEAYFEALGIVDVDQVTEEDLVKYSKHMENENFASSTISRSVASIRAFFHYLYQEGKISSDPSIGLKAPKVERKVPQTLSVEDVDRLLSQPSDVTAKGLRDRAMLELLYATGMKASGLVHLEMEDVNLKYGYVSCRECGHERVIPISRGCSLAMERYLESARAELLKGQTSDVLFPNCSGKPMSRQGFWKLLKYYGKEAGIEADITPHTVRHAFAVHMLRSGADYQSVQDMLGNSCVTAYPVYFDEERPALREVYRAAQRRRRA